nr:uncharacterized protein LOC109173080 [Ipomoea batatas]
MTDRILRLTQSWLAAWQVSMARKERVVVRARIDCTLSPPTLRCYVDMALFEEQGLRGFCALIKNGDDRYIAAKTSTQVCSFDPYYVELWAIKEVLPWNREEN